MMDEAITYQFRWKGTAIEDFARVRRQTAEGLRHQAEILKNQANQIDAEIDAWTSALVPSAKPGEG